VTTPGTPVESSSDLLSVLGRSADAEIAALLSDARATAGSVLEAARTRRDRRREAALAGRRTVLAHERERRLDGTRTEVADRTLRARDRFVSRVLTIARERVTPAMQGPDGGAWLSRTLASSAAFLPPGEAVLAASHPDAAEIAHRVEPGRRWSSSPLDESSGAVVAAADGSVRIDATFERFVRAERSRLAQSLVARVQAVP
jgi:vacuolar-type H+-ATPase subunit E/Vma4